MSEAKVLKNGIPSFDANGVVSMVPQSKVDSPLGFTEKTVSVLEVPEGGKAFLLLADVGAYPLTTGFGLHGFSGLVHKYNNGYVFYFGMAVVNAVISYSQTPNGMCLTSTLDSLIPVIVKYNGHVYVAIRWSGNNGSISLCGKFYNCLDNPIVVNNRNGFNVSDVEVLNWGKVPSLVAGGG